MPDDQRPTGPEDSPIRWNGVVPPLLMAAGAASLLRNARLLGLTLLGAWLFEVADESDRTRRTRRKAAAARRNAATRRLDEEIAASFPASDPPSFSGAIAGAPD